MSDSFISIVPTNVTHDHVKELSQKTVDWLTQNRFISSDLTECVLGSKTGYPPGPKYKTAIEGDDYGLLRLKTNGVEVVTKRQVYHNGQNGLEEINCPQCGANNVDSDWGEVVTAWENKQNDKLKCSHCAKESSIIDYQFNPCWGFGEFGLTFWNWPSLKPEFMQDLEKLMQTQFKVIFGKL